MTDEKKDRIIYTRSQMPDPSQMSPSYTQLGRQSIPLNGPYKDKLGAEHCATHNFEWVGLVFPGENEPHVFNLDDLQPAD
jgi:hypothetical protein